jgi:hypothetical protein
MAMELQVLREIISEKYLGYAGIHAVGTKGGKITVYYEQFKGNSMGAWDQSLVLQEIMSDVGKIPVELIPAPKARI